MADVQLLGPPGDEIDLRDTTAYVLTEEGFSLDPHDEVRLEYIPGGTVNLSRDDENARELKGTLFIGGATRTERKANREALESVMLAASRYVRTQGRQGEAAFYTEQWDDEPSADVYQVVRGRLTEKSRQLLHQYIECSFYLLLKPKL